MKYVNIYTDGSCLGNPGPGGWCAILILPGTIHRREIAGGYRLTTNNRMEITAVLESLKALKEACEVNLHTDSQYVADAVNKGWLYNWQNKGWKKSDKKSVPNEDLWRLLLPLLNKHLVHFHWLRGHAGHPENERCDLLARTWAQKRDLPADEIYERLRISVKTWHALTTDI